MGGFGVEEINHRGTEGTESMNIIYLQITLIFTDE